MTENVVFTRSNPLAPDPRVEKETKSLAKAGYSVSAVGWDRIGNFTQFEVKDRVNIYRLPIQAKFAQGLMNFFPLLLWQIKLLNWLVKHQKEFNIIHACDFDTIFPALICKILFRKKIVYDIFDFYADHLRATPEWIKKIIRKVDLCAINQADAVILVDESRKKQIYGSKPKKLIVIYNSPEDQFDQMRTAEVYSEDSFKLVYVGLLQVERGLLDVLEILKRHPNWFLDLAGFGGDEDNILEISRAMDNVSWHGRIPYTAALQLSARADTMFALYDPAIENHKYSSPNKVFEALMLGKPIVVSRGTNMDHIIEETGSGLVVEYGSISEIETAFNQLAQNSMLRADFGIRARQSYLEKFSWSIMEKRLLDCYSSLV